MILVTGATGNVGTAVVHLLQHQGVQPRVGVRNIAAARAQFGEGATYVPLDFTQPATFAPALAGARKIFLVRPPALADARRYIWPAIAAAQRAGVEQIVFLSLLGAERNPMIPHHSIERYLQRCGLSYTFLRASFFMQNLDTIHRAEIRERQEIVVPAGRGKTSFVDVRDIAAVAVRALTETGHEGQAYALTGSEALDYHQVAAILSHRLGRQIVYRHPSLPAFLRRARAQGTPWGLALVMASLYTTCSLGLAARVTEDTARLLGRAPITLAQYVADYRARWE